MDFSRLGQLSDNAFIESFNGKFGAECLNENETPKMGGNIIAMVGCYIVIKNEEGN